MPLQISVIPASERLAADFGEFLSEFDASVQILPVQGSFWDQANIPTDLLFVWLSRIPQPIVKSVQSLCQLPKSPRLLVFTECENAEIRDSLLAAGASAVVNTSLEGELWFGALRAILERSSDELKERVCSPIMQGADRSDWLPEGWLELPWSQLRRLVISGCEHEYIRHHLKEASGRIGVVAKRTGLSSRAVNLMMKRQGVRKEEFRARQPIE